jgi:hypothetical protein
MRFLGGRWQKKNNGNSNGNGISRLMVARTPEAGIKVVSSWELDLPDSKTPLLDLIPEGS